MLAKLKNRLNNRKGFTLIELIVVIAIIAILAAVLIPQMAGFTKKAKSSNTLSEAKNIATAFSAMIAENPSRSFSAAPTGDDLTELKNMAGQFTGALSAVSVSITGGVDFTYTATAANGGYQVVVADGQVGTPTIP